MTVWISNYAGHDYSSATSYGEFKFITKGYVSFQSLDRVKYGIVETVAQTDREDWLLISGRPLISIIAALAWYTRHGQVKVLHYDQKTDVYRELVITATNITEIMETL
jgi:hypothetical protein